MHQFKGSFAELRKELESTYTKKARARIVLSCAIELVGSEPREVEPKEVEPLPGLNLPVSIAVARSAEKMTHIGAIKYIREVSGIGLVEAKNWVEANTSWGVRQPSHR